MRVRVPSIGVALLLGLTTAAFGQVAPALWLGAEGGFGTYSMSDVNLDIQDFNASSGLQMDEISKGLAFGVNAGVNLGSLGLGLAYERVTASSEISDATGSLEYNFPANAVYGLVQYRLPSPGPLKIGFGGGLGMISSAGSMNIAIQGLGAASGDISGSGILAEARVFGDYHATPMIVLSPSVGYRYTKVPSCKIEGQQVYNADGSKLSIDYSGIILRAGIKFMIG